MDNTAYWVIFSYLYGAFCFGLGYWFARGRPLPPGFPTVLRW